MIAMTPEQPSPVPRRNGNAGATSLRSWELLNCGVRAFCFDVPFPLRSKSNFRRGSARAGADWAAEQAFRAQLAVLARAALPEGWDVGTFELPLASRPTVVSCVVARTLLDAGNLSKSVLDAVEGIVVANDAAVRSCLTLAERGASNQRGLVGFACLAPGASLAAMHDTVHILGVHMLDLWATPANP